MTARSAFRFALALTLVASAGWTAMKAGTGPQSLSLLLLGAGLAIGAHVLKHRDTSSAR